MARHDAALHNTCNYNMRQQHGTAQQLLHPFYSLFTTWSCNNVSVALGHNSKSKQADKKCHGSVYWMYAPWLPKVTKGILVASVYSRISLNRRKNASWWQDLQAEKKLLRWKTLEKEKKRKSRVRFSMQYHPENTSHPIPSHHNTTQRNATQHNITQHNTLAAQHIAAHRITAEHSRVQRSTAQHSIAQHSTQSK